MMVEKTDSRADPKAARAWLNISDRELLAGCAVDVYRASGPGGQKRNKTSSAVRLRHLATGLIVIAEESRSQQENRQRALRRLREAVALTQRNAMSPGEAMPDFYAAALQRDVSLRVSRRHPDYWRITQHVLDTLFASRGGAAEAAALLGLSTGQLVRFLKADSKLWERANLMRQEFGRGLLR
jgi:hypothetical protein